MDREQRRELAATMSASPAWLRRTALGVLAVWSVIWKVFRVIFLLQGVTGIVTMFVGAATLDAKLALTGLGQAVLAGLILFIGMNPSGEQITDAVGPEGAFIVRAQRRAAWREERGWAVFPAALRNNRVWTVAVRRRPDDPFGHVVLRRAVGTRVEADEVVQEVVGRIREGRALSEPPSD
jgi:hypothetical protein